MGLLERAIASNAQFAAAVSASGAGALKSVETFIADFSRKNPSFYCILLQGDSVEDIPPMVESYGAACADVPGGKCLALLPSGLDGELFAHRLSHSTGSSVLFQSSITSSSLTMEMLNPYIQE